MKRRKCFEYCFLLFIIPTIYFIKFGTALPSPARSCRDHYLSGHSKSTVLPLRETLISNSPIFRIECKFPEYSWQPDLSIVTLIHNGLEQWLMLNLTEKKTIGYQ